MYLVLNGHACKLYIITLGMTTEDPDNNKKN